MANIFLNIISLFITSFYSLQFQDIQGNTIQMSSFQGKKVLIVSIATGSDKVQQLGALEQLYQHHHDSLVVIAFPTNSFGHDSLSNIQIAQYCQNNHNTTFIVASKVSVIGLNIHPVFEWLAEKTKNGSSNAVAKGDFQKFLITEEGKLVAILSPKIDPMSNNMIEVITTDY